MFDLGKGLLDRIEVRGIGRQKQERGSGFPDRLPYGLALMAAEIVHDHDVAGLKNGRQLLLGVRQKACAVDRPIEDARRGEPVQAQRADEGQRSPMAMRSISAQALALWPPAAQGRHVGLDPGLVNEDQLRRIKALPPCPPALTPPRDVRARLFEGEQRFF